MRSQSTSAKFFKSMVLSFRIEGDKWSLMVDLRAEQPP